MASSQGIEKPITSGEKTTAWILLGLAVAANAAGYFLNWFGQIAWYDDVVHGFTIFALTLVLALYMYGASITGATSHALLFVITVAAVGLAIGGLWEIAEWSYDRVVEGDVIKGKRDTILDLVWDSMGSLVAGIVALAMVRD